MPTPREIAKQVNKGTAEGGFETEPSDEQINPVAREQDYRANPKNPPDGPAPAKVSSK